MAEKLREGFTTGSAATGAALAALQLLRTGTAPDAIPVPLPPFRAQGAHNQCKNTNGLPEPRGWLRLKIETAPQGLRRNWVRHGPLPKLTPQTGWPIRLHRISLPLPTPA